MAQQMFKQGKKHLLFCLSEMPMESLLMFVQISSLPGESSL